MIGALALHVGGAVQSSQRQTHPHMESTIVDGTRFILKTLILYFSSLLLPASVLSCYSCIVF